eukprot:TRINITY_DN45664_c0_g1_i3.p1 TRINITY_DN45664_c0_g1~~TRINITY_DN45664_c0_g1_i3.p1  ORF type:complete len:309 (+),score=42.71 TRINITY_DN45664_c0_g1_i3:3-929(+)
MYVIHIFFFFFQAEDGIRDLVRSRGLGDVYKRQASDSTWEPAENVQACAELVEELHNRTCPAPPNEYEAARLDNIHRNQKLLATLGLSDREVPPGSTSKSGSNSLGLKSTSRSEVPTVAYSQQSEPTTTNNSQQLSKTTSAGSWVLALYQTDSVPNSAPATDSPAYQLQHSQYRLERYRLAMEQAKLSGSNKKPPADRTPAYHTPIKMPPPEDTPSSKKRPQPGDDTPQPSSRPKRGKVASFQEGDLVRAIWNAASNRRAKEDARIDTINADGTYGVRWHDGLHEASVLKQHIFPQTLSRILDSSPEM